jgi:hypothetical protein
MVVHYKCRAHSLPAAASIIARTAALRARSFYTKKVAFYNIIGDNGSQVHFIPRRKQPLLAGKGGQACREVVIYWR